MIWISLFLFVWTAASVGMIIRNLGDKYKQGPTKGSIGWYWQAVFYAPAFILARLLGMFAK